MIPALAVCGLGLGLVVAPLINIILAGIHAASAGSASGVLTTVQQVGGALGRGGDRHHLLRAGERLRAGGRAEQRVRRCPRASRRLAFRSAGGHRHRRGCSRAASWPRRPAPTLLPRLRDAPRRPPHELPFRHGVTTRSVPGPRRHPVHRRTCRDAGGRGGLRPRLPGQPLLRDGLLRAGVPDGLRAAEAEEPVRAARRGRRRALTASTSAWSDRGRLARRCRDDSSPPRAWLSNWVR